MNIHAAIGFMRDGMLVRRYHQYATTETDTVGKHSCGVALFANLIHPEARKQVILAALYHDLGEGITGDIPSPTKRMLSNGAREEIDNMEVMALKKFGYDTDVLNPAEIYLLKLCDCFDGLSFCIEERGRGNRTLEGVGSKYLSYLDEAVMKIPTGEYLPWYSKALEVHETLTALWRKSNESK